MRQWQRLYPMDGGRGQPRDGHGNTEIGRGWRSTGTTRAAGRKALWLGHLGGTPNANAVVAYDPALGMYVAVAVNNGHRRLAVASGLLDSIYRDASP
jgi:CubicO group peptidase (beta-lactamase class C family)